MIFIMYFMYIPDCNLNFSKSQHNTLSRKVKNISFIINCNSTRNNIIKRKI